MLESAMIFYNIKNGENKFKMIFKILFKIKLMKLSFLLENKSFALFKEKTGINEVSLFQFFGFKIKTRFLFQFNKLYFAYMTTFLVSQKLRSISFNDLNFKLKVNKRKRLWGFIIILSVQTDLRVLQACPKLLPKSNGVQIAV